MLLIYQFTVFQSKFNLTAPQPTIGKFGLMPPLHFKQAVPFLHFPSLRSNLRIIDLNFWVWYSRESCHLCVHIRNVEKFIRQAFRRLNNTFSSLGYKRLLDWTLLWFYSYTENLFAIKIQNGCIKRPRIQSEQFKKSHTQGNRPWMARGATLVSCFQIFLVSKIFPLAPERIQIK